MTESSTTGSSTTGSSATGSSTTGVEYYQLIATKSVFDDKHKGVRTQVLRKPRVRGNTSGS
eukprot:5242631-Pyramimonas_sp.AAC.1